MIKGIAHIALNVKDMDESLKFYCDILGFTKAFSILNDNDEPWIEYIKMGENQFIELFYGGKDNPPSSFSHVCMEVEGMDEVVDGIIKRGGRLDIMPNVGKDHNVQAWIVDPDGNRIELMELSPLSPQKNC